jgi:hypothetical protein
MNESGNRSLQSDRWRRLPGITPGLLVGLLATIVSSTVARGQVGSTNPAIEHGCPLGEARVDESGQRRLALLVGVGHYAAPEVTTLDGPPNDVRSMFELLTGTAGYGFPEENVCVLVNEAATSAAFERAWQKALVDRASKGDIAVFFFAGHGSQARDWNGDEPDGYDETLLLYDARHERQRDLIDDRLNGLVADLYAKTTNVTMILDSCNSGTASRGGSRARARFFDRLEDEPPAGSAAAGGDGGEGWEPESMPGLVVLSGARDGSSAMEIDGAGVFTQALIEVMSEVGSEPLTYAQVSHRVPRRIASHSQQAAYFQGDLDRVVFGASRRERPASWVVRALEGSTVRLQGVPMPGWSRGALLRVHSGSASLEELKDSETSKGYLQLEEISGFEGRASYVAGDGEEPRLEPGDLALLVQAGEGAVTISFRPRSPGEKGGLSSADLDSLRKAWTADEEAGEVVEWSESGEFEVAKDGRGRFLVLGPEGRVRNTIDSERTSVGGLYEKTIHNLENHAAQKALLGLRADPGSIFENDRTLRVRVVPEPDSTQNLCARGNPWLQAEPGEEQLIPMCHRWAVEVTLDPGSPRALLVGGVVLWNDGSQDGFPRGNERVLLGPGEAKRISAYESLPPLGVPEHVLVFGTQEDNPVDWGTIHTAAARGGSDKESALGKLLKKYFKGKRGGRSAPPTGGALQAWTSTHLTIRAEANVFLRPDSRGLFGDAAEQARALVIPLPDMRPYAPADREAGLYRVLEQAVLLSDLERSGAGAIAPVWEAFSLAGLEVPSPVPGLAELADRKGPMAREFEACEMVDLRTGDLIVMHSASARAGHLAMVLDPREHVVWGALGWNGEAAPALDGVAFHHQRFPRDWAGQGLAEMRQAACWRHRTFVRDHAAPSKRPGSRELDPAYVCGDAQGRGCPTNRLYQRGAD